MLRTFALTAWMLRHAQVCCVDLRGQGCSAAPRGPYSIPLMAADISDVIEHAFGSTSTPRADTQLAAPTAPHVVGWSLGAGVALQLAIAHSACVRSAVVFGFTATFGDGAPTLAAAAAMRLVSWPAAARAAGVQAHGALLALLMRFKPPARGADAGALLAARRAIHASNGARAYAATLSAWKPWDATSALHRIRCRVLYLHVAGDAHAGHTLAKKQRDVALINAGAGRATLRVCPGHWSHAWPFEQRAGFNAALCAFLEEQRQR